MASTIRRCLATAMAMAGVVAAVIGVAPPDDPRGVSAAAGEFVPLPSPQRLLDSRPGATTADGLFAGIGIRASGSVLELQVAGRVGVPGDAESVALDVTTDAALEGGFVTVFACGSPVPNASNLNYAIGQTIANALITRIGTDGKVCLYNFGATNLIADVTGYFPTGTFEPLSQPARLLDTRPGTATVDGQFAGIGVREARSTLELTVAGRAGVPDDASAVALNVTVDAARGSGFVTVFACGVALPTASNLNYVTGQTIANAVVTRVGANGAVCFYTDGATDLIVDVAGEFPATTLNSMSAPQRLLDTRPGLSTSDGMFAGGGVRPAESTLQLLVAGRAGVPENASAVVLNVTADAAVGDGFVTIHAAGTERPNASNLNYRRGQTIANAAIARVGAGGQICLYTFGATHLVVDVAGWLTGPAAAPERQRMRGRLVAPDNSADHSADHSADDRASGTDDPAEPRHRCALHDGRRRRPQQCLPRRRRDRDHVGHEQLPRRRCWLPSRSTTRPARWCTSSPTTPRASPPGNGAPMRSIGQSRRPNHWACTPSASACSVRVGGRSFIGTRTRPRSR